MRLTYRPDQVNKKRPAQERNRWDIAYGDTIVGTIQCDIDKGKKIAIDMVDKELRSSRKDTPSPAVYSHNKRIWLAQLRRGYDPLEFPDSDDHSITDTPYTFLDNNDLVLTTPVKMTMNEARQWVRTFFFKELLD